MSLLVALGLGLAAWLYLEALRLALGDTFSLAGLLARPFFIVTTMGLAWSGRPFYTDQWRWSRLGIGIALLGLVATVWYAVGRTTSAAWLTALLLYIVVLWLDTLTTQRPISHHRKAMGAVRLAARWFARGILALIAGLVFVAIVQVESQFAEEEFFDALQAMGLVPFGFLLLSAFAALRRAYEYTLIMPVARFPNRRLSLAFRRRWLILPLLTTGLVGIVLVGRSYQQSFYPLEAPPFPGISADTPFLCGHVSPAAQSYEGRDVYRRLIERVAAVQVKTAAEYALLALSNNDLRWARSFHDTLLSEATAGQFTEPANSVKSVQRYAALRAYYYARMREAFPGLFNEDEDRRLRAWFAAINRRALTVEWVDWMYALAFSKWPEGPYENQETGAALLATLEHEGLADPQLSPRNRDYLERNRRGWEVRFRNNDDALIYQPEWFGNAFLQSRYTGVLPLTNLRRSIDWLLLQALPDGGRFGYNHPFGPIGADVAYLSTMLLNDPTYLWYAGRLLDGLEQRNDGVSAQPGIERPVDETGGAPTVGSCLLYADTGLPNQVGPLGPDKIVFRNGWETDSTYLLLNLRFTGWHRYKATNTVTLFYQGGTLAYDSVEQHEFDWLPIGRRLLRDKRIPRERLNGLLIERSGMSAVLATLLEVSGQWTQDPPFYARVVRFETGEQLDTSSTVLEGWRGWRQQRTISFYHNGPIVIEDEASGPTNVHAALAWNLPIGTRTEVLRVRLREGAQPAELLLMPLGEAGSLELTQVPNASSTQLIYNAAEGGRLHVATLLLTGPWVGAWAAVVQTDSGKQIEVRQGERWVGVPIETYQNTP